MRAIQPGVKVLPGQPGVVVDARMLLSAMLANDDDLVQMSVGPLVLRAGSTWLGATDVVALLANVAAHAIEVAAREADVPVAEAFDAVWSGAVDGVPWSAPDDA